MFRIWSDYPTESRVRVGASTPDRRLHRGDIARCRHVSRAAGCTYGC